MPAIFISNLKFQKPHLYQWKPINNGPVLLKVSLRMQWNYRQLILAKDGLDGNGLQLEKFGPTLRRYLSRVHTTVQSKLNYNWKLCMSEFCSLLQSIYVTRDRVILKFEARVQIYMAVLNICCEIQNSGRNVVRFSKINSYGISFWLVLF